MKCIANNTNHGGTKEKQQYLEMKKRKIGLSTYAYSYPILILSYGEM